MGDTNYLFPVALKWEEGPEKLKQLRNKLLLYFQSKNKSNGGECEIRDMESSQGYVLIHFREETVREQVLQKRIHELKLQNGKKLPLSVTLPNSGTPQGNKDLTTQRSPIEPQSSPDLEAGARKDDGRQDRASNLILIENVQDTCSPEMLNLLVENISEKDEDIDFYVERIPEISSAVITFTCEIDNHSFFRNFTSSLRANQYRLVAKLLEETRSIRVEKLPQNTPEDHIIVYFESSKYGGGRILETVMLPEESAALITFCKVEVVKMILKKQHVFGKTAISVYPYYPSLGIFLYGRRAPDISIPKPLEFNMSPYILKYILNNGQIKHDIDVKMEDKNCEITWPDTNCPNPVIKLGIPHSLSTSLRTMAKVVRKWNEEVSAMFSLIISKYKVIDCKMNPSVWETIREHVSSSTYEGVLIKPEFAEEKVYLSGTVKDVHKVEQTFRNMVEATTRQIDRKNQSTIMTIPVSPALYQIMSSSGLEKKILDDVPELKIEYDIATKNIRLTGLKNEALLAKCEILTVKQQLESKSIQMNPHIIQFLMFADKEELSCLLLVRHNINALVEIEDNVVKLTGYLKKDLTEAEEQLKRELDWKQIPVEDKSVLRSPGWKSLQSHLCESFNAENRTVLVQEFPPGAENDVVIAGLSTSVQKCHRNINEFLEKNSPIQKNIPVRSKTMMQFIEEEKKEIWGLLKQDVKVVKSQNNISLSGPRTQVEEAASLIHKVLSSLHCDTLRIVKPGAKKFCRNNEEMHSTTAKTKFNCAIYLQTGVDDQPLEEPHYQIKLPNGLTISVYKGDLCRHNVDVIVNAANEDLKHVGGLALALLKAAGHSLQDDCDRIVRKEGPLSVGDSVITDAGKLPCKQVIHTVGPRWNTDSRPRCEQLLRRAITSSLELAAENAHSSIAIPAVSSGVFGFPLKQCAENILKAIRDYVETQGERSTIQRIHLVDMNVETVKILSEVAKLTFGDLSSTEALTTQGPQHYVRPEEKEKPQVKVSRSDEETVMTKEGLIIKLVEKNIEDATTEVIVSSVGANLNLNSGTISKSLYNRAGSNLQQLLNNESQGTKVALGSVFKTDGCNLNCEKIFHVVAPHWDGGQGNAEQILRRIITDCLTMTEQKKWKSITFPAIGTGNLGFPKVLASAVMFEEIFQFSCKNKLQNLQEIQLVLHPSNKDTIKAFSNQLANCTSAHASSGASNKQPSGTFSTFCGTVTNPSLGVHEMRIGSLTYQVKTGDITKEDTEIIVNSSNQDFTLQRGVSKAILEAAGPTVQLDAMALGVQPHKGYIVTQPGNLQQCKRILHLVGPTQPANIKKSVLDSLQECEKYQAASVAFPALGTGAGGLSAAMVADGILDAVLDFISSKSLKSVQTVKVVIFQQNMLNDFYMSMKKKEGTAVAEPQSLISKITAFFKPHKAKKPTQKLTAFQLMDNIEPVIFSLCAAEKDNVDKTKVWLQERIEFEQAEKVLTDEWINELEDIEKQKISDLQKKFQVSVVYKPPDPSIRISGLTRDVMDSSTEIQVIINRVRDNKTRERAAELTRGLVEWKYEAQSDMIPFDLIANLELEEAKNGDKKQITVQTHGKQLTVNLQTETATDRHGKQVQITRVFKHEEKSLDLPKHWKPMSNNLAIEVDVAAGTPEFLEVQQKFQQSCRNRIIKIERIQNKDLWMNYQIKKQSINTKNGSTKNERQLFHGTDFNSIQNVNQNGYNRGYAGRNAAAIGNGTYFAVNASYSASSTYSKVEINGHKHMYLARVLTGMSCAGKQGMVAPPAKNPANPTDLYDSVTDNTTTPSMYVIFSDIQAYPEYHITFC